MRAVDHPRAGRREWVGLAVLALPCLLYAMDLTVLNLALPQISADLKPSSTQLLWIVDIYGFLAAADPRIGQAFRRRCRAAMTLGGLLLVAAGGAFVAASPDGDPLIAMDLPAMGFRLLKSAAERTVEALQLDQRRDDLRNHVAGSHHHHLIADPDVLAAQLVLVRRVPLVAHHDLAADAQHHLQPVLAQLPPTGAVVNSLVFWL